MDTKNQSMPELKAERVQEERVAVPVRKGALFVDVRDEPVWVSLKAERVQEPASVAAAGNARTSSELEMTVGHKQPITIELQEGIVIKLLGLDGSAPGSGSGAGSAEKPKAA